MKTEMPHNEVPTISGTPPRVAIICSSYYSSVVEALESAAEDVLMQAGIPVQNILHICVPGAFEIPLACKHAIQNEGAEGVIALGIIVEGETHHAAEIARACTNGLMQVQVETNTPIAHEVLYVDSLAQAKERANADCNKGEEAAITLLATYKTLKNETKKV